MKKRQNGIGEDGETTGRRGGIDLNSCMFEKYYLGFCPLDLPALVLAVLILLAIIIHNRRFKKKREEYFRNASENKEK